MKFILLAACGLALTATSAPAFAEEEQRRTVVPYADLDLSRGEGVAMLERRVKRAVRRVCRVHGAALWERVQQTKCVKHATREANAQVARAIAKARTRAGRGAPPSVGAAN